MSLRSFWVVALLLLAAPVAIRAQEPRPPAAAADSVTELRLRDGSVLYGQVVEESAERVVFVTTSGSRLEIARGEVTSIRRVLRRASGAVWPEDPNRTRLFFTSTARGLEKGEGYVSSFMLFFPFVAYGITDQITIAGGTPILPGVIGEVFYLAPKVTVYEREKLSFAVGALGFFVTDEVDAGSIGIVYGASTIGGRDRALTLGAGWGYIAGAAENDVSRDPVFMIGGEQRISRRVKLITENWLAFGSGGPDGLISAGFRFIGDRLSADLGFGGAIGESNACCLPLVNFVYSFGGGR